MYAALWFAFSVILFWGIRDVCLIRDLRKSSSNSFVIAAQLLQRTSLRMLPGDYQRDVHSGTVFDRI